MNPLYYNNPSSQRTNLPPPGGRGNPPLTRIVPPTVILAPQNPPPLIVSPPPPGGRGNLTNLNPFLQGNPLQPRIIPPTVPVRNLPPPPATISPPTEELLKRKREETEEPQSVKAARIEPKLSIESIRENILKRCSGNIHQIEFIKQLPEPELRKIDSLDDDSVHDKK